MTQEVDLAGRLMADMDPELLAFLRSRLNSFVKWDLVRFFYENPHTTDTAENIARYAGRNVESVATELHQLAEDGLLDRSQLGQIEVYSLTPDPHIRDLIERFVSASDDRQFRIKAIYHVIRGMR